ncbi:MAG: hypothetical protein AMK73_01535 [Planctomycetes bacterium SM23_32]|nr:MAG: hypothetical protein AMK73_01535 [Planctomycetes bacterium SM23_32]
MFLNLCPQTIGLERVGFEDQVELAARHGFGGVDFPAAEISSAQDADRAADLLAANGLRWGLFHLPCDFLQGDDVAFQEGLELVQEIASLAARAGCTRTYNHVWPGSNERQHEENWRWHVSRLRRLTDLLGPHGIRLGIEFIGPKTLRDSFRHPFVHTLPEAARLADAVGADVGIVMDTFHWYTSGGTLDDIRATLTGRRVVNVHVNDAVPGRSREEQLDLERQMPLTSGLVDAAGVLRVLDERGYEGPVICEPFQPSLDRLRSMEPDTAAHTVADCMRRLFDAAGVAQRRPQ